MGYFDCAKYTLYPLNYTHIWVNATFCFLWFTKCVLLLDKNLILGCLWPLVFVFLLFYICCLLHVGPPFGNRILNNSWAVGLTWWIMNLIFCVLTCAIIYVLIHQISFRFYLLKYSLLFSSTLVLTSSIDVVFILSIWEIWQKLNWHNTCQFLMSYPFGKGCLDDIDKNGNIGHRAMGN